MCWLYHDVYFYRHDITLKFSILKEVFSTLLVGRDKFSNQHFYMYIYTSKEVAISHACSQLISSHEMYRYIALFLCIGISSSGATCHDNHSCKLKERLERYNNRQFERVFDKTARFLISADEECHHNCNIQTINQIRDVYQPDGYYLRYNLPNFNEEDFTIKIKHRVIYVNAEQESGISFRDVRTLPQIIKPYDGFWFLESNDLVIKFNYKGAFGSEVAADCNEYISNTIQTLPRSTTGTLRSGGST